MSTLSKSLGQFMSSILNYYVQVRNQKNISFYMPHERERTSGSREKQTFIIFCSIETTMQTLAAFTRKTIITTGQVRVGDRNSG